MTEPTAQPPTAQYDAAGIRDFSLPTEPKHFRLDPDVFKAPAVISSVQLARFAELYKDFDSADLRASSVEGITKAIGIVAAIFELFMTGEEGKRFTTRLLTDGTDPKIVPIDLIKQAIPVMYWLLEEYGMRPTEQSSPLLSDSVTGDSADGALAETSTGEASPEPLNS